MIAIAHSEVIIMLLNMPAFPKPIHLSHQFIREAVQDGDTVVDATLGNGHDALFLSKLVGERGFVVGFDVQDAAIQSSNELMQKNEISAERYRFIHAGHETIAKNIETEVSVVMFNLGYLPNADKSVITTETTTLRAIQQSIDLLKGGGLVSIMCYPGHEGGDREASAVRQWCSQLKRENYRVAEYGLLNAPNHPPFLVLIERTK